MHPDSTVKMYVNDYKKLKQSKAWIDKSCKFHDNSWISCWAYLVGGWVQVLTATLLSFIAPPTHPHDTKPTLRCVTHVQRPTMGVQKPTTSVHYSQS